MSAETQPQTKALGALAEAMEAGSVEAVLKAAEELARAALRDQFALHAPDPPQSFQPDMPPWPTLPSLPDGLTEGGADIARNWRADPVYDLSDSIGNPADKALLAEWEDATRGTLAAQTEWRRRQQVERIVQWRWHYADLMVAARERRP